MRINADIIDLVTFFPFSKNTCNTSNDIRTINQFKNNQWKSKIFYPNKLNNFYNCSLRLGAVPALPASDRKIHQNGTIEYFGSDIKTISELARRLNFFNNISFYPAWGEVFENGSGTLLAEALINGSVNIICGWNFLTSIKRTFLDFTQAYFFVPFVLVVPPGLKELFYF
ncbi:hypothetical protein PVAND_013501 [Polypedilum vanderplanki]|uniref:Uncharacterized protein n=1 Tax=Polypedilum vanderplanki TaxID=319348 RepID=A0A9J6CPW0_POLVA|nr:hypothetical protein PVAND_013501 [Polypedilum vanderplanki]